MPFYNAKSFCFLISFIVAKGEESIDFYIRSHSCISGKRTLSLICRVHHPKVIKLFRNGIEMSQCTTFPVQPFKFCQQGSRLNAFTKLDFHDGAMIYTIETKNADILSGEWICQNGGANDERLSKIVHKIRCEPTGHSSNDFISEQLMNIVKILSLIIVSLFGLCVTSIYRRLSDGEMTSLSDLRDFCKLQLCCTCKKSDNSTLKGPDIAKDESNTSRNDEKDLSTIHVIQPNNSRTKVKKTLIEYAKIQIKRKKWCEEKPLLQGCTDCLTTTISTEKDKTNTRTEYAKSQTKRKKWCEEKSLLQGCTNCLTTTNSTEKDKKNIRTGLEIFICFLMVIVYVVVVTYLYTTEMEKNLKTGLYVICLLSGFGVFLFVSVIWTSKKLPNNTLLATNPLSSVHNKELHSNAENDKGTESSHAISTTGSHCVTAAQIHEPRPTQAEDKGTDSPDTISQTGSHLVITVQIHEPPPEQDDDKVNDEEDPDLQDTMFKKNL